MRRIVPSPSVRTRLVAKVALLLAAASCGGKSTGHSRATGGTDAPCGTNDAGCSPAAGAVGGAGSGGTGVTAGTSSGGTDGEPAGGGMVGVSGTLAGRQPGIGGNAGSPITGGSSTGGQQSASPPCCSADSQCKNGTCVNAQCESSVIGECWSDDECHTDQACSAAFGCACAADCPRPNEPGWCVTKNANCCLTDADCPSNYCVAGVCMTAPSSGQCWSDRDCVAPAACAGALPCPCGARCTVAPRPGSCSAGP